MNDSPELAPAPGQDPLTTSGVSTPGAAGSPALTEPPLSEPARIINTYVAPSRTFTDIRRNAQWWGPYVLSMVISVLFTLALSKQIGWDHVAQNALAQQPAQQQRIDNMPPEQKATVLRQMSTGFKYGAYATPVIALIVLLIVAAVLLGTVNFLFGGHARFGQMFAVVNYAFLPNVLKYLFATVMLYVAGDPDRFNLQNPVGTNPGFYMDPETPRWLASVLSSVDLFSIWIVVLLVLGCAIVGRIKRSQAAMAVVGWYVLVVLVGAAWAAFRG